MADVPYPLTGNTIEELERKTWELIRTLYEEKIGGADLGDVFSIVGDVLVLTLAAVSGLTKSGNVLAIDPVSTGGMAISASGLYIELPSSSGLQTDATGLSIKLDGDSLTISSSGIRVNSTISDDMEGLIYYASR